MTNPATLFSPETFHDIGPFRFPVYHDLTPAESRAINAALKQQASTSSSTIGLARRIGQEKGIPTKEAMERLRNLQAPENEEILYDYLDEINGLNEGSDVAETRNNICTIVMQMRGLLKDPNTGSYDRTPDWGSEDTDVVPSKFLDEIFQYIMWERDGWPSGKSSSGDETTPPSTPTTTSVERKRKPEIS